MFWLPLWDYSWRNVWRKCFTTLSNLPKSRCLFELNVFAIFSRTCSSIRIASIKFLKLNSARIWSKWMHFIVIVEYFSFRSICCFICQQQSELISQWGDNSTIRWILGGEECQGRSLVTLLSNIWMGSTKFWWDDPVFSFTPFTVTLFRLKMIFQQVLI